MCEVITRIDFTYHSLQITLCRPLSYLDFTSLVSLFCTFVYHTAQLATYTYIILYCLDSYHTMYRHDIAEILLKVALNTKNQSIIQFRLYFFVIFLLTCILHIFN